MLLPYAKHQYEVDVQKLTDQGLSPMTARLLVSGGLANLKLIMAWRQSGNPRPVRRIGPKRLAEIDRVLQQNDCQATSG